MKKLSIGLMSGTSMDGIDVALLETDGQAHICALGGSMFAYDPCFKQALYAAQSCAKHYEGDLQSVFKHFPNHLKQYLETQNTLAYDEVEAYFKSYSLPLTFQGVIDLSTLLHAKAVENFLDKKRLSSNQVDLVGYHGQTLYHQPEKKQSVMIGEGQHLAKQLDIDVISCFRDNDIQAGGQGAPLAPLFHQCLAVRDALLPCVVLNCGGISNISYIPNADPEALIGFDAGPGNGLIDRFVRERTQGAYSMDAGGVFGQQGKVNQQVLQALLKKGIQKAPGAYFKQPPPKSLDYGDLTLIEALGQLSIEDGCRTLEAFTAQCIVESLAWLPKPIPQRWILAGGGWHNPVILLELQSRLKQAGEDVNLIKAKAVGWDNDVLEAQIFAHFAVRSLKGLPLSVPGTTGVKEPLSGGVLYKAPLEKRKGA